MPRLTISALSAVHEEAAHPGAGRGGGEAGHQALLSAQGHQQGRVQGHPEEGRAQGGRRVSPPPRLCTPAV